jgi:hypothetical protein
VNVIARICGGLAFAAAVVASLDVRFSTDRVAQGLRRLSRLGDQVPGSGSAEPVSDLWSPNAR